MSRAVNLGAVAAVVLATMGLGVPRGVRGNVPPEPGTAVTSCTLSNGTATFSPGVTTTAKVQNIVARATLTCTGGGVTGGTTVTHLKTSAPIDCAALARCGGSTSGMGILKWVPKSMMPSIGPVMTTACGSDGPGEQNPLKVEITGSIAKGTFVGDTLDGDADFTPVFTGKGTPCSKTNPLKKVTFTGGFCVCQGGECDCAAEGSPSGAFLDGLR